jgi:hypothetical protein
LPTARAAEPPPPVNPAISEEAATAVSQMGKTLLSKELSFTAKTIRVYQDEAGQPLHIFHSMNVVARRPDRLAAHIIGDDGSHDVIYDGKSVAVSSSNRDEYVVVPATGDILSALRDGDIGVRKPRAHRQHADRNLLFVASPTIAITGQLGCQPG